MKSLPKSALKTTIQDFLLLAMVGFLATFPLYLNSWLQIRYDAVVHIGIINAIKRCGLAFGNPFLAGKELPYYWGYNLVAWLLHWITGIKVPLLLALINSISLALIIPMLYLIVRVMGGSRCGGYLGALMGIFGLNGFGWFALIGNDIDFAISGIIPYFRSVSPTRERFSFAFFTSHLLCITSLAPGLAFYASSLLLLEKIRQRGSMILVILTAAMIGMTTFINLFAGAVVTVCALSYSLFAVVRPKNRAAAIRMAIAGGIGLISILVSMHIFTKAINPPSTSLCLPGRLEVRILFLLILPFLLIISIGILRRGTSLLWISVVATAALFLLVKLPAENQYKFIFFLVLQLGVLAGVRYGGRYWRKIMMGLVLLLTLPTTIIGLFAFQNEPYPDRPIKEIARLSEKSRNILPHNAVIITENLEWAIPVFLNRDAYLSRRHFLKNLGYQKEVSERTRMVIKASDPAYRAETLRDISYKMGRPVYWLGNDLLAGNGMEVILTEADVILAAPSAN